MCPKVSTKHQLLIFLALVMVAGLSGCVTLTDFESSQDYTSDVVGSLDLQTTLGQSFVSRRPNLNSITIWLTRIPSISGNTSPENANILAVSLYLAPGDPKPIYSSTIAIPPKGDKLPITISVPNQKNRDRQSYYLQLSNSSGTIRVNGRVEDIYPPGQAYRNGQPINADLAFRLTYDYGFSALFQDIRSSLTSFWLIFPLLAVAWLPGWLLLDFSGLRQRYDFGEQTAISMGLSLALVPVLLLWTSVIKLKWSLPGIYTVFGLLVAVLIYRMTKILISSRRNKLQADGPTTNASSPSADRITRPRTLISTALVLIFLVSLAVRLIMIRDLATPTWVDSVHHALITRLILENGAYPSTYQPYLDIAPSSYHPGFHGIAAAFTWLSQLDLARALLILGQALNALCGLSVYLFTKTLTRSSVAGLFAAVVTSFLSPMPAYYTSWGRYTELTGLLLLPVILALIKPLAEAQPGRQMIWVILLGAITGGGLFMVHYRVLAFLVCLIISYVIFSLIRKKDSSEIKPSRLLAIVSMMAALGIFFVFPWFLRAVNTNLLPYVTTTITSPVAFFQDFSWSFLTSALGKYAMAMAGLGLVWGMIQRKAFPFMIALWVILLLFLANLAALRWPGGGLISNASVEIMLFIPISVLAGYFLDQLLTSWKTLLPSRMMPMSIALIVVLTGYFSYLGARQLVPILNPVTILSRSADLRAMDWVEKNISLDETVVINPFSWGYGLYAGNDGGYWISPLTGRITLPPPVLYGLGKDAKEISDLSRQIIDLSSDTPALLELMHSHQLHYVYIGARGGVLSPQGLISSGLFTLLYHQDGVWIFGTKP